MERLEVDLPLRALVNNLESVNARCKYAVEISHNADVAAVVLLIVVHKVLDVCDDSFSLNTLHNGRHLCAELYAGVMISASRTVQMKNHQSAEKGVLSRQIPSKVT
jgi:hypothetical protein